VLDLFRHQLRVHSSFCSCHCNKFVPNASTLLAPVTVFFLVRLHRIWLDTNQQRVSRPPLCESPPSRSRAYLAQEHIIITIIIAKPIPQCLLVLRAPFYQTQIPSWGSVEMKVDHQAQQPSTMSGKLLLRLWQDQIASWILDMVVDPQVPRFSIMIGKPLLRLQWQD
jgi:hypothetical protein